MCMLYNYCTVFGDVNQLRNNVFIIHGAGMPSPLLTLGPTSNTKCVELHIVHLFIQYNVLLS